MLPLVTTTLPQRELRPSACPSRKRAREGARAEWIEGSETDAVRQAWQRVPKGSVGKGLASSSGRIPDILAAVT